MIRHFTSDDRQFYMECSKEFYSSDAVVHNVDCGNFKTTFDMLINKNPAIEGFIIEHDGKRAGYFLASFTYSNEVGVTVMWLEELFILPEFRGCGLATSMFEYVKAN